MYSSKKPSLLKLLCETSRIITTHPLHFLSLSALFLFPISFLNTLYPLINFHPTSLHSNYNQFLPTSDSVKTELPSAAKPHLQIQLLYTLLVVLFNICAISSITRSTINALQDHPVQFVASLKSVPISFFPVLGTKLVSMIILGLVFFAFGLCTMLPYIVLTLLGFNMNYPSIYFFVFVFLTIALAAAVAFYIGLQSAVAFDVSNCCFGIYVGFCSVEKKLVLGEWDEKGRVLDDNVAWDSVSHCVHMVHKSDG
ncbi:hypothetical protein ACS0TY_009831 [Phlomoides rotata]